MILFFESNKLIIPINNGKLATYKTLLCQPTVSAIRIPDIFLL